MRPSAGVIAEYRDAFMNSALAAKHFARREEVWEAAMTPNDGGVRFLPEHRQQLRELTRVTLVRRDEHVPVRNDLGLDRLDRTHGVHLRARALEIGDDATQLVEVL